MKSYKFKVRSFQPLTDMQWSNIADLIAKPYTTSRPPTVNLHNVVDGLRYLVRTGCQWRNIGTKYENPSVLRYYFDLWNNNNT
jgi:transposase